MVRHWYVEYTRWTYLWREGVDSSIIFGSDPSAIAQYDMNGAGRSIQTNTEPTRGAKQLRSQRMTFEMSTHLVKNMAQ